MGVQQFGFRHQIFSVPELAAATHSRFYERGLLHTGAGDFQQQVQQYETTP